MKRIKVAVVEDRNDPLELGRVRVRVVGIHDSDTNYLPTEDLPWACPVGGCTSAGISGVGATQTGLVEGSSVLVTDNDLDEQQYFILGSIAGRPVKEAEKDSAVGFQDIKTGTFPYKPYLEESDLDRNLTGIKIEETSVIDKRVSTALDIEMPNFQKWSQPENAYNTKYPYSLAFKSESGHLLELDDTYESERLNILHKTGTYSEVNPDGSQTNRIRGDKVEIIEKSGMVYIKGAGSITIDGNAYVKVNNAFTVEVSGPTIVNIMNDATLNVSGSLNLSVVDSLNIQASAINMESYFGDISIKSAGDIYNKSGKNIHVTTANHMNIDTGNLLNLNCGLAMEPKMNALQVPPSRRYPNSPEVGASGIV